MKNQIPKSLNLQTLLTSFKKLFWLFLLATLLFNIVLFYFLNGGIYVIALVVGNIVFVWLSIPIMIWIGKSILVNTGLEAVEEVKETYKEHVIDTNNVIKVIKKDD